MLTGISIHLSNYISLYLTYLNAFISYNEFWPPFQEIRGGAVCTAPPLVHPWIARTYVFLSKIYLVSGITKLYQNLLEKALVFDQKFSVSIKMSKIVNICP